MFFGLQLLPRSVETKIPPVERLSVPAKILFSCIATDWTFSTSNPEFFSVQLAPLSVEIKIPLPDVPAIIVFPLLVIAWIDNDEVV